MYAEVIHFYEGRIRRKISQYSAACRGYMVEWNNKQVDITDHYCLAEIKQSGQRRFISPPLPLFSPAEGAEINATRSKAPVQFFVYTPIIEKLITERQNLMREILCASLMFCCFVFPFFFYFSSPSSLGFSVPSSSPLPPFLFFYLFIYFYFIYLFFFFLRARIIGKLQAIREI